MGRGDSGNGGDVKISGYVDIGTWWKYYFDCGHRQYSRWWKNGGNIHLIGGEALGLDTNLDIGGAVENCCCKFWRKN